MYLRQAFANKIQTQHDGTFPDERLQAADELIEVLKVFLGHNLRFRIGDEAHGQVINCLDLDHMP